MDVYTSISQLPPDAQGAVIAVGNFDGVHKGHQAVIKAAKDKADAGGLPFGVLTFEPHPRRLFRPDDPPFRITSPSLKWERLKECGAGFTLSLPFDWDFASQSADDFITSILKNGLRPAHIFAGEDFRFGQLRKGSLDTVREAGIPASGIKPVTNEEDALYSSTSIRQLLRSGEIAAANALLGWEWHVDGAIVRGDRRGHELGYPTANVPLGDTLHPAYGVYASYVRIEGDPAWYKAATNIGIRPMFELQTGQIEAHILDFPDIDIYGKNLRIRPVKRLRGEAKFASLEALVAQIAADCGETRHLLT